MSSSSAGGTPPPDPPRVRSQFLTVPRVPRRDSKDKNTGQRAIGNEKTTASIQAPNSQKSSNLCENSTSEGQTNQITPLKPSTVWPAKVNFVTGERENPISKSAACSLTEVGNQKPASTQKRSLLANRRIQSAFKPRIVEASEFDPTRRAKLDQEKESVVEAPTKDKKTEPSQEDVDTSPDEQVRKVITNLRRIRQPPGPRSKPNKEPMRNFKPSASLNPKVKEFLELVMLMKSAHGDKTKQSEKHEIPFKMSTEAPDPGLYNWYLIGFTTKMMKEGRKEAKEPLGHLSYLMTIAESFLSMSTYCTVDEADSCRFIEIIERIANMFKDNNFERFEEELNVLSLLWKPSYESFNQLAPFNAEHKILGDHRQEIQRLVAIVRRCTAQLDANDTSGQEARARYYKLCEGWVNNVSSSLARAKRIEDALFHNVGGSTTTMRLISVIQQHRMAAKQVSNLWIHHQIEILNKTEEAFIAVHHSAEKELANALISLRHQLQNTADELITMVYDLGRYEIIAEELSSPDTALSVDAAKQSEEASHGISRGGQGEHNLLLSQPSKTNS